MARTPRSAREQLERAHAPEAIRARLQSRRRGEGYLGDAVLGGIDGCVTTFAVVAGVAGGGLAPAVALLLGVANLLADGLSMAVGNYQNAQSRRQLVEAVRREEAEEIEQVPEGEREEIRQIFAAKGFEGETLERVVDTLTENRERWIDTMVTEEHGLPLTPPRAGVTALVTFAAFCVLGFAPLVPYLLPSVGPDGRFALSAVVTGVVFFGIGMVKGWRLGLSVWRGGGETLLLGGCAAVVAYGVGYGLRGLVGG